MSINDNFRYLNVGLPEDILRRKLWGDFDGAIRLIDQRLAAETTPKGLAACLRVQREMISRLGKDFPYSREEAIALVREHIPDFTEEEFDRRVDEGKIRWIYVKGQMRIFDRFFASMCKSEPAFAQRAGVVTAGVESTGKDSHGIDLLNDAMAHMKSKGSMTTRIRIKAGLKLKDEQFTPGMFLRAHLPIPAACDQQSDIVIESVYPPSGKLSPADALQRTVCWEETMEENHEFSVVYSYRHKAVYHDTDAIQADLSQPTFDTQEEEPHIVFTPYIRELVATLSEGTDDPLEKARRFYDFITINMKYTYMPAYFSLENIAETCARSFTGDCGVFALLFLTMCRCAGIPAQWQSGLTAEPEFIGGHDWVRFYIAPYGWLYADPSYGTGAVRVGNEERRRFYFGNLDAYRMVANRAFQADFQVGKQHWRADPYDNQLGELESENKGYAFDEYERWKEILLCERIED
ncbi:MAG: transglutaminase domain-containing protein [Oscillospiraceae bacterium]|nr:transglutaminase domain-containing protein [Oscillospiraceae bacterium]